MVKQKKLRVNLLSVFAKGGGGDPLLIIKYFCKGTVVTCFISNVLLLTLSLLMIKPEHIVVVIGTIMTGKFTQTQIVVIDT